MNGPEHAPAGGSRRAGIPVVILHGVAAAALVVVPALWAGRAFWNPRGPTTLFVLLFAAAYLAVALPLALGRRNGEPRLARVVLCGLAAFGSAFVILAFLQWRYPAIAGSEFPAHVAFTAFAMGMVLLVTLFAVRNALAWKLALLIPVVAAGFWGHVALRGRAKPPPAQLVTYIDTSLYVLKSTAYPRWVPDGDTRGGGIAPLRAGYLLVSGDGWLYLLEEDAAKKTLKARKLAYRAPFNPDEFKAGGRKIFGDAWQDNSMDKLRVADVLVQPRPGDGLRVLVSHHLWKPEEACTVVRVSLLEGSTQDLLDPAGRLAWRTLHETSPCLELNTESRRGMRFGGLQIGGAMDLLSDNELLLTVGDHEFDGFKRSRALPQDPANSYGKVFLIRLDTGQAELYSLGHRNPQGLHVDPDGGVWALEHGPRGGDELNFVKRGANYGWPSVTYGTDYRLHDWPLNPTPGRHEGFEKPAFAFVPSIAVSSLAAIEGSLFDRWAGDLLAGSFFGGLLRIRVEDGRVVFAEPVRLPGRIRDIAEGADGRLLVWTDENDLTFLEPAAAESAESLLSQCLTCHTLTQREVVAIAPSLRGIVGRPVASAKGFAYSRAMERFGGRWTKERLDSFLADPRRTVPGTTMEIEGVADPGERKRIIELLELQVEEQVR